MWLVTFGGDGFAREIHADKLALRAFTMHAVPKGSSVARTIHIFRSASFDRYARSHGFSGCIVDQDIQEYANEEAIGNGSGIWPGGTIIYVGCQAADDAKEIFIHLHFDRRGNYRYYVVEEYRGATP